MLTFHEAEHKYFWNGKPVPNVTTIIKPLSDYSHVDPDVLEKARQEGVAIHKMTELYDKGELEHTPDWMAGHRAAYEKFLTETRYVALAAEQKVYSESSGYAGTLDKFGKLYHPKLKRLIWVIIDVKRSFAAGRAIGVQTMAYAKAWNESTHQQAERVTHRFGLQLQASGNYRLREFSDPGDWAMFLACLTLFRYREQE